MLCLKDKSCKTCHDQVATIVDSVQSNLRIDMELKRDFKYEYKKHLKQKPNLSKIWHFWSVLLSFIWKIFAIKLNI